MSIATATAAPSPIKIGDREYLASPVNFADLGELEERVKSVYIATAAAKLAGDGSILDRAMARAMGIDYRSEEMGSFIRSEAGALAIIGLSLRQRQPEIDEAAVLKTLKANPEQFALAVDTIMRISGMTKEGGAPGEAGAGETGP
jgi:hypothetical protein